MVSGILTPLAYSPPPSLVVFDLDFTLWQRPRFRGGPPFEAVDGGAGGVRASCGATLYLYPAARRALAALADARCPVAIASRTHRANWARQWLGMLTIDESRTVDDAINGWPVVVQDGPKRGHLQRISDMSGVPLNEFLFFDDDLAGPSAPGAPVCPTIPNRACLDPSSPRDRRGWHREAWRDESARARDGPEVGALRAHRRAIRRGAPQVRMRLQIELIHL